MKMVSAGVHTVTSSQQNYKYLQCQTPQRVTVSLLGSSIFHVPAVLGRHYLSNTLLFIPQLGWLL